MKIKKISTSAGFSLVELVIAVAIFMIFAGPLAALAIGGHLNNLENQKTLQAQAYLTESWEALKAIRNQDWANMVNGTHGLAVSGGQWVFSGTSDSFAGITRTITVSDVQRNNVGDIVSSGGTVDPDTKEIVITLNWSPTDGNSRQEQLTSYLTHYSSPSSWPPEPAE